MLRLTRVPASPGGGDAPLGARYEHPELLVCSRNAGDEFCARTHIPKS